MRLLAGRYAGPVEEFGICFGLSPIDNEKSAASHTPPAMIQP
jgi:hypothetical protein